MAIIISIAALMLSSFVFAYNHRTAKRDLMIRIYDQLLAADRQQGRRVLFELCEYGRKPEDLCEDDFRSANHALAWLDLMAMLYDKRYIPRRDSMALWGITTSRIVHAAEQSGFLQFRDNQQGSLLWPYVRKFAAAARAKGFVGKAPSVKRSES
ncbi:MAG TPA: hypothetical protein VFV67_02030 [Actinophytocola sp.]|uniref:hypothetical protein n=1 Tax=Actinophytocola sp. TaxID=1872138 RepID=UPI002DBC9614|nr:hypothetical protein [Actinophytocola sp.]HEU5469403.1 hypothetical protein [Actinophytocola sp.]